MASLSPLLPKPSAWALGREPPAAWRAARPRGCVRSAFPGRGAWRVRERVMQAGAGASLGDPALRTTAAGRLATLPHTPSGDKEGGGWTGLPVRFTPCTWSTGAGRDPEARVHSLRPASLGPTPGPGWTDTGVMKQQSVWLRGGCWDVGPWVQCWVGHGQSRGTDRGFPRTGQLHDHVLG